MGKPRWLANRSEAPLAGTQYMWTWHVGGPSALHTQVHCYLGRGLAVARWRWRPALGGTQRGLRATDPPLRARVDSTDSNPPAPPSTGYGPPAAALQPVCCTCCTYSCPGSCG